MRFTLLPDPRYRKHFSSLLDRLDKAAKLITREKFNDFSDHLMTTVLEDSFNAAGGDEGTLWLRNFRKREFDARFNNRPAPKKNREISQNLDRGPSCIV